MRNPKTQVHSTNLGHPLNSGGVGWFGVNGDAGDLREALLDEVLEGGEDVMNARDGILAFHYAVTGDQDVVLHLADAYIVAIEEFVVIAGHVI